MNRTDELTGLLRWYPRAWRERYGDEFVAFLVDSLGEDSPTVRIRISIAFAGLRERGYESAMVGACRTPYEQVRAGALVVLGAWMVMVLAGLSLVKTAEHFGAALPVASRHPAQSAYDLIALAAFVAAALVVSGALVATSSFVRFMRDGGWSGVKGHFVRASIASLLSVVSILILAHWAHHLNSIARNGGDTPYVGAFVIVALIATAALALWTYCAIEVARHLRLTERVLRLEAHFAEGVAGSMVAITLGAILWWQQVGLHASWYLQGTVPGVAVSPITPKLVLTTVTMVTSSVVGLFGVLRIAAARRRAPRDWLGR